jgi:serine protease SohB
MIDPETSHPDRGLGGRVFDRMRSFLPRRLRGDIPIVPVVRLSGAIGFSTPLRPGLTLASVARPLERAFAISKASAVALLINSPGGSAVQSHLIFRRIRDLAAEKKRYVIAFIEDVAASGGYMLACAADEIVCDASSMVGSIGVVGGSFGVHRLMERIGVERRLYTAGEHKVILDPFLPEKPEDVERIKVIQKEIHESFIALVKASRGARLTGPESALFSGEFWGGQTALSYGVVDAIGDLRATLRARYGDKVATPLIAAERRLFGRRVPGIDGTVGAGTSFADDLISALEARALWGRYGL